MTVKEIKSLNEFRTIINCGKVVAIDLWATWCSPRSISPVFEALSEENNVVEFYKVDVDDQPDIAQEIGVRAMPTFVVFKDGNKINELVGADQNASGLRTLVTNAFCCCTMFAVLKEPSYYRDGLIVTAPKVKWATASD